MEDFDWDYMENFIASVLNELKDTLSKKSVESAEHLLEHREYEMSFEGLCLDIMNLPKKPSLDWIEMKTAAKTLSLDKESVYDDDFWNKFESYLDQEE
ncbi:MAG: hypothetical protein AAFR66_04920 [Bacteroidota bacterium]